LPKLISKFWGLRRPRWGSSSLESSKTRSNYYRTKNVNGLKINFKRLTRIIVLAVIHLQESFITPLKQRSLTNFLTYQIITPIRLMANSPKADQSSLYINRRLLDRQNWGKSKKISPHHKPSPRLWFAVTLLKFIKKRERLGAASDHPAPIRNLNLKSDSTSNSRA
jgi:hypothetical protein